MAKRTPSQDSDGQPPRKPGTPSDPFREQLYEKLRAEMVRIQQRRRFARWAWGTLFGGTLAAAMVFLALSIIPREAPTRHSSAAGPTPATTAAAGSPSPLAVEILHPERTVSRAWLSERIAEARDYIQSREFDTARQVCAEALGRSDDGEMVDGLLFVQASALDAISQPKAADEAWAALLQKFPFGRYAREAAERLCHVPQPDADPWTPEDEPGIDLEEQVEKALSRTDRSFLEREALGRFARHFPGHRLSPRAVFALACDVRELGRLAEAMRLYGQVVSRWPRSECAPEAQAAIVCAYRQRHLLIRANEECRFLIETYPTSLVAANAMLEMGNHWFATGEFTESARWYRRLLAHFPSYALAENVQFKIALCYERGENPQLSAMTFEAFAREFPDSALSPKALLLGGQAYGRLQKTSDACTLYQSCIRRYPNTVEAIQAQYLVGHVCTEAPAATRSAL